MATEKDFIKMKFKWVGKCKVCKIAYADPELFTLIHKMRFQEDYPLATLVRALRSKFEEKNYSILMPTVMNLSNHFSKHIPIDLITAYQTAAKKTEVVKIVSKNELPSEAKKALSEIVDERVSAYDDLEKLYKKTKLQIEELEKEFGGKIDLVYAPNHIILIRELKSFLVELSKMNSNEQLVKVILQTAFQKYTLSALQSIVKECNILKLTLRSHIKDIAEIDRLVLGHQNRLYEGLSQSSKEAILLIKDQYKIN